MHFIFNKKSLVCTISYMFALCYLLIALQSSHLLKSEVFIVLKFELHSCK